MKGKQVDHRQHYQRTASESQFPDARSSATAVFCLCDRRKRFVGPALLGFVSGPLLLHFPREGAMPPLTVDSAIVQLEQMHHSSVTAYSHELAAMIYARRGVCPAVAALASAQIYQWSCFLEAIRATF
jgi:hypothetical protein